MTFLPLNGHDFLSEVLYVNFLSVGSGNENSTAANN